MGDPLETGNGLPLTITHSGQRFAEGSVEVQCIHSYSQPPEPLIWRTSGASASSMNIASVSSRDPRTPPKLAHSRTPPSTGRTWHSPQQLSSPQLQPSPQLQWHTPVSCAQEALHGMSEEFSQLQLSPATLAFSFDQHEHQVSCALHCP